VSRRGNRQRREDRRVRPPPDLHPPPEPFDQVRAFARWRSILTTAKGRGFTSPPFEHLTFGPVVAVDPILDGCGSRASP